MEEPCVIEDVMRLVVTTGVKQEFLLHYFCRHGDHYSFQVSAKQRAILGMPEQVAP
jgi:hypothetical protein